MKAYSATLHNGVTFLIHGWTNKEKGSVCGKYPNGESDRMNIGAFKKIDVDKIDEAHNVNYPPFDNRKQ